MTSTATWRNYITMREAVNTCRIRLSEAVGFALKPGVETESTRCTRMN